MSPTPDTHENKRREKIIKGQLRQIVKRQKRLLFAHHQGKHADCAIHCPACNGARIVP